ncbi:MAG: tyrosine-type recombinase/integrase, partial [Thermoproteota archaeon]
CQVGALSRKRARNLVEVETRQEEAQREGTNDADVKGKIVEYIWFLKKQGYAKSTVKTEAKHIKGLVKKGADLFDPDSVKKLIAQRDDWSEGYKANIVSSYNKFAEMVGLEWDPPHYEIVESLPFIPLEKEIDALIAGCGKKVAASLQLMKETAMRIGEAWDLRWTDVDEERCTVRCRAEKHGNPRMFKVSRKLIDMLNALSKDDERVFGGTRLSGHRWNFNQQRKRLASKLQNPRLQQIHFHTLRHWKATMEYHKTKDILHVKQMLGHRNINSTLVYTQLVSFETNEYHVKTAKTVEEAKELAEAGFNYFTEMDDVQIFRKRK